jgi:hypothetical protein
MASARLRQCHGALTVDRSGAKSEEPRCGEIQHGRCAQGVGQPKEWNEKETGRECTDKRAERIDRVDPRVDRRGGLD